ncbi:ABC transporter substrate-binding protein [Jeongeupia chitinilytica]|uniref:Aryl sulfate ester ABC transporter n=1 Tax=Jeongeupia chitinilytica TaxID=1041641 RepID=A0ABQ3H3B6_9NEIS|nr:ABC transporter substrate-binding protein [Jeongeupia chitinilytica]GHD68206.1 aryl sulfate ester ABC transporter [Jeongeupia chitinilytica]
MQRRHFLLSTLVLALSLTLPAVSRADDRPAVIRIGVASVGTGNRPVFGGSSVALANVKGVLEDEFKADGIKVEWNFFKGAGPAVNEALANKLIDFAWQGDLPALIGKAGGLRTRLLIADGTRGTAYLAVPSDSTAKTLEDLKGRKVALFKGTNAQLVVAKVLDARGGLSERDFKSINMDSATTQAAIATKDIDAGWFGPEVYGLVDRGIARVVYTTKGQAPNLARQTHFLVTEDFEKKYPQITQRVVTALVKQAAWASDDKNREQVLQQWSKSGVPYNAWKQDYDGTPLRVRLSPLFDDYFVQHYKDALALSKKFKLVRGDVDIDAWLEPKYQRQALRDLKLEGYWPDNDARGVPKK